MACCFILCSSFGFLFVSAPETHLSRLQVLQIFFFSRQWYSCKVLFNYKTVIYYILECAIDLDSVLLECFFHIMNGTIIQIKCR